MISDAIGSAPTLVSVGWASMGYKVAEDGFMSAFGEGNTSL